MHIKIIESRHGRLIMIIIFFVCDLVLLSAFVINITMRARWDHQFCYVCFYECICLQLISHTTRPINLIFFWAFYDCMLLHLSWSWWYTIFLKTVLLTDCSVLYHDWLLTPPNWPVGIATDQQLLQYGILFPPGVAYVAVILVLADSFVAIFTFKLKFYIASFLESAFFWPLHVNTLNTAFPVLPVPHPNVPRHTLLSALF